MLTPAQEAVKQASETPDEPFSPNLENLSLDDIIAEEETPIVEGETQEEGKESQTDVPAEEEESSGPDETVEDETKVEEETEDGEPPPLIEEVQQLLGIEFGEDVQFEDSVEGIVGLVKESAVQIATQHVESTLDQFPHLREYYDFLRSGGDPNRFLETRFPETDFSEVQLTDSDEGLQERMLSIKLKQDGHDDQTVQDAVQRIKAAGLLQDESKLALSVLQKQQEEAKDNLLTDQQNIAKQQEQEVVDYWDGIEEELNGGNVFSGVAIPEDEKKGFFEYISAIVEGEGVSQLILDQRELSRSKDDRDKLIASWFLSYKKFDLSDLITKKARSLNKENLRDRLKGKTQESRLKGVKEDSTPVNVDEVDWEKQDLYQEE